MEYAYVIENERGHYYKEFAWFTFYIWQATIFDKETADSMIKSHNPEYKQELKNCKVVKVKIEEVVE